MDIRGIHIPNSNHGNHIFAQFTVPLLEQLYCACTIETSYSHSPEPISNSSSVWHFVRVREIYESTYHWYCLWRKIPLDYQT